MPVKGFLAFRSKYWISIFVLFFLFVPVGCGSGTTGNGSGPTWQYAPMGDSLAAGALAQEGYVPRYATYVNDDTGSNVTTLNMGIPGWQSGDLLNALNIHRANNRLCLGCEASVFLRQSRPSSVQMSRRQSEGTAGYPCRRTFLP